MPDGATSGSRMSIMQQAGRPYARYLHNPRHKVTLRITQAMTISTVRMLLGRAAPHEVGVA